MAEILTPAVQINLEDFTRNVQVNYVNGTVAGEGIFDTLMETATKHLLAQFESNRIRQEDYANAYIHIYEVTLQAALKAWLEKDMVAAQIRQTEAQTRQTEAATAKIEADILLTNTQKDALETEMSKTEAETAKIQAETELLPLQKEILAVEKEKVEAETLRIANETRLIDPQIEKIEAETAKISAEQALIEPQIDKLEAEVNKLEAELTLVPKQLELMIAQIASEEAKVALAEVQKGLVIAQTASEAGKKALYKRQIEGFDEDFKQKIIKIMMDSWAVGFSVAKDSFEASGIPATMQKTTIDDLYNTYIKSELDKYTYNRTDF